MTRAPDPVEEAREAVARLYAGAPAKHRHYVSAKLKYDPLTRELIALVEEHGSFGDVIDAGGGRGQFGMLLLLLGAATTLRGFDYDEEKVEAARAAAEAIRVEKGTTVEQAQGDVTTSTYDGADTVLLLDVLHYLPRAEQLGVIDRIAAALRPGGFLIIREATPGTGLGARFAQLFERIGRAFGANRGRDMEFVPTSELCERMVKAGLRLEEHAPRGPLNNQLIVGRKA